MRFVFILLLLAASAVFGQETQDSRAYAHTFPFANQQALSGACTPGEWAQYTGGAPGVTLSPLYQCGWDFSWHLFQPGGGGGGSTTLTQAGGIQGSAIVLNSVSGGYSVGVNDTVVAFLGLSNTFVGTLNDFSGSQLRATIGTGVPSSATCSSSSNVGFLYERSDTQAPNASSYACHQTSAGGYAWELIQSAGGGGGGITNITVSISSGTQGGNSCSSPTTATMTGLSTSMVPFASYTANPNTLTGWGATGGMVFQPWASASNTLSYVLCNQTSSSITYSAITFGVGAK